MMILAFAMSQSVLANDPHDAALTCARVAASHGTTDVPLVGAAHITYYVLQAARAKASTGSIFAEIKLVQTELSANPTLPIDEARGLVAACDARFPSARRGSVRLPASNFDRVLTCATQLSIMGGAAEKMSESVGDRTALTRYSSALRTYTQQEDAVLKSAGYANESAASVPLKKVVVAALDLGNPYEISEACIAAL